MLETWHLEDTGAVLSPFPPPAPHNTVVMKVGDHSGSYLQLSWLKMEGTLNVNEEGPGGFHKELVVKRIGVLPESKLGSRAWRCREDCEHPPPALGVRRVSEGVWSVLPSRPGTNPGCILEALQARNER